MTEDIAKCYQTANASRPLLEPNVLFSLGLLEELFNLSLAKFMDDSLLLDSLEVVSDLSDRRHGSNVAEISVFH